MKSTTALFLGLFLMTTQSYATSFYCQVDEAQAKKFAGFSELVYQAFAENDSSALSQINSEVVSNNNRKSDLIVRLKVPNQVVSINIDANSTQFYYKAPQLYLGGFSPKDRQFHVGSSEEISDQEAGCKLFINRIESVIDQITPKQWHQPNN